MAQNVDSSMDTCARSRAFTMLVVINHQWKPEIEISAINDALQVEVHKWISTHPTDIDMKMLKVHLWKHLALQHQDNDLDAHRKGQGLYKACWIRIKLAGGGEIKLKECGALQNVANRE
jgi:hypothetical protein